MRPLAWMIGASVLSWVGFALLADRRTGFEVLCGMLGPLAAVCWTWMLAARLQKSKPEAVMPLMVMGFAVKLLFFGAYVAVMLRVLLLRPGPFAASFTGYFIVLYLIEALYLRRLFWGGMRASR